MSGILYGVGVGPGDPELMTVKAVRIIEENTVIAFPGICPKDTTAYKIVTKLIPDLANKELLALNMPMTKDENVLKESHEKAADQIEKYLKNGENVVYLSLGDISIYSTYAYLEQILHNRGYNSQMIAGIPSFCAAASKIGIPLSLWNEALKIVATTHSEIRCEDNVNYIYMKAGKSLGRLKKALSDSNKDIYCIENCGMEDEHIYHGLNDIPDEAGYYTLLIVKDK